LASKPENTFILSVHKYLPPKDVLHREKMNNPYRSGTADWWYSGSAADLWVEFKYIPKLPVKALVLPDLSPLQKDWLDGRYKEGRNVAVVVGSPQGAVIYRSLQWLEPISPGEFLQRCVSKQQLAMWLQMQTLKDAYDYSTVNHNTTSRRRNPQDSSK
jgi:hypothetical protein